MAIVWHTEQLVSTATNLTSEMSPSNEMTVIEEDEDPWKKSYTVYHNEKSHGGHPCTFRESCSHLLPSSNPSVHGLVTPP